MAVEAPLRRRVRLELMGAVRFVHFRRRAAATVRRQQQGPFTAVSDNINGGLCAGVESALAQPARFILTLELPFYIAGASRQLRNARRGEERRGRQPASHSHCTSPTT